MVEKALTQPPAAVATPPTTVTPAIEGNVSAAAIPAKRKGRRRKFKRLRARDQTVIAAKKRKFTRETEVVDPNSVETNTVLRKLLRGPRYFDPSNSSWSTCFNCGEEGHVAVFCTSQEKKKKQKPCFVCGSLDHGGKQCTKARACYICKQIGHLARVCPDKEKLGLGSSVICLKCGESGHEMFSCKSDYSPSDLKEIQCYICRNFGHVCCVESVDIHSSKVSCYRCGQLGHTGSACSRQRGAKEGETTQSSCNPRIEERHLLKECKNASKGEATPIPIYNCGEGGDLSQECKSLIKMYNGKDEEAAMPNSDHNRGVGEHFAQAKIQKRKSHDDGHHAKSEPQDSKANKRKKQDKDKKITTPQKPPKHSGGSIKAEPGEKSFRQSNKNSSGPPRKPSNTDQMVKGKKPFKPSNKNSWRSSPPRPPYTDHMVTRVSPGDQMYNHNRFYGGDMVNSNGTPYNHHQSHIYQPQSSSSPHLFHHGTESYPGLPISPHVSSFNPHMFQHGDPSPYHDPPRVFSSNPHVFQYEASAYPGLPMSPHISSANPHMVQHRDPSPYHDPHRVFSPNPHVFQYEASAYRGSPVSFQYGDSFAYRASPRSPPHLSANPRGFQYGDSLAYQGSPRYQHISNLSRVEYEDSLAFRDLPRSPGRYEFQYRDSTYRGLPRSPHISSPGRYEFQYRDSSYRGSLGVPQPSAASPFWNHGNDGMRRNPGW